MKINVINFPGGIYKARIIQDLGKEVCCGYGKTWDEAIGDMVHRYKKTFGITEIELQEVDYSTPVLWT